MKNEPVNKLNFIQAKWFCYKCGTTHFGNCPKLTTTITTSSNTTGKIYHADYPTAGIDTSVTIKTTPDEPVNKQLKVGDTIWSDYFNRELKITRIISDDNWYFELDGRIYKAQTTLSYIENNPLKAKEPTTVNKQLEEILHNELIDRFSDLYITAKYGHDAVGIFLGDKEKSEINEVYGWTKQSILALIQSEKVKATQDCELSIMKDLYSLSQTQWQAKYGYMFEPPDRTGNK